MNAWDLSIQPEIYERISVDKSRKMIGMVIFHIHEPPCPNKMVLTMSWTESLIFFGRILITLYLKPVRLHIVQSDSTIPTKPIENHI